MPLSPTPIQEVDPRLFHSARKLQLVERESARTREFEGTGTPYLSVPGLKALDAVRIGYQPIALSERRSYPRTPVENLSDQEVHEEPIVAFLTREDGSPVLQRAILSNDGIWQKGETVYVTGDWEGMDEPDPDPAPETGEKPPAPTPTLGTRKR